MLKKPQHSNIGYNKPISQGHLSNTHYIISHLETYLHRHN